MNRTRFSLALLLGLSVALGGCDVMEREQAAFTEMLLADAGFQKISGDSDPTAPSRELVARNENGRTIYLYKDLAQCGCIYVGGPEAEARYRNSVEAGAIARSMIWNDL